MGHPALYSVAARYAAMTDEEIIREVRFLAYEGPTQ